MIEHTGRCPRCPGKLTAKANDDGSVEVLHTQPPCASFATIRTIDDAIAIVQEARETRQRALGLPVTVDVGDA